MDGKLHYVMFGREDPKTPVVITDFPIADERIQQLMPSLLKLLDTTPLLRRKLFQVEFLATLSGDLLVTLVYHRHLDSVWEEAAKRLLATLQRSFLGISIVGRSRGQKVVLGKDYVQEVLKVHGREYRLRQYEQSFSQPNGLVNIRMIEWACKQVEDAGGDMLELYCGNGNFTLPLSHYFNSVIATETAKLSIRSAMVNLAENNIQNVHLARLSAEEVAQAVDAVRTFRRLSVLPKPLGEFNLHTLFLDPPRSGLDEKTVAMARRFPTIIYMSCNPQTLVSNLRSLKATHQIKQLALFDQFPYTDHMECGVLLKRH
jgi:tRNA (uracil-5-)-methyltransferase